jgi:MFS family permease
MQGTFFVISVFLQQVRHYNAIQTGLTLTPATIGTLVAAGLAERMAKRRPQATLVRGGFVLTLIGMILLLALVRKDSTFLAYVPGLLSMGLGIGVMLTASVNVVQSSFPESDQGDISGVSRSVSNLGSSLGVAFAGSVLVSAAGAVGNTEYAIAIGVISGFTLVGLVAAMLIPKRKPGTVLGAGEPDAPVSSPVDEAPRVQRS